MTVGSRAIITIATGQGNKAGFPSQWLLSPVLSVCIMQAASEALFTPGACPIPAAAAHVKNRLNGIASPIYILCPVHAVRCITQGSLSAVWCLLRAQWAFLWIHLIALSPTSSSGTLRDSLEALALLLLYQPIGLYDLTCYTMLHLLHYAATMQPSA